MMKSLAPRLGLAFVAASALALAAAGASAYEITPISQTFEPSGKNATQTFQVTNDSDQQVTVTIKITTREVDVNGKEVHNPTKDFSAFPSEIVLPPHGMQVVRAKWMGDPAPKTELAYRLIAEETPLKTRRDTPGASIYMTVRYVGSLYVLPKGARSDVKVKSATPVSGPAGKPMLELLVENAGSAHAVLENPTLTLKSGNVTKVLRANEIDGVLQGENVLAQHQRKLTVAAPQGLPAGPIEAALTINPTR
jgi:fimbrial chaperone protein